MLEKNSNAHAFIHGIDKMPKRKFQLCGGNFNFNISNQHIALDSTCSIVGWIEEKGRAKTNRGWILNVMMKKEEWGNKKCVVRMSWK